MPQFGTRSMHRLSECHQDLQTICHYAIKIIDFSVVFGKRTQQEQFDLFQKGRIYQDGIWVINDKSDVVTYKDGIAKKSRHQSGNAIDIIPYPTGYQNEKIIYELAGVIKGVAFLLKNYGNIEHSIEWGQDLWSWDANHFQLKI